MNEQVFHEKYGKGISIKKRYLGFQQLIRFESGVEKWIRRHELKSIEEYDPEEDKNKKVQPFITAVKPIASEEVASEEVASEEVASEAVASDVVASDVVASEVVASEVVASEVVASEVVASDVVAEKWYCIICGAILGGKGNICSEKCGSIYRDFQLKTNARYKQSHSMEGFCNACGRPHTLKRDPTKRIWNRHAECYSNDFIFSGLQIKNRKQKEILNLKSKTNENNEQNVSSTKSEIDASEEKNTQNESLNKNESGKIQILFNESTKEVNDAIKQETSEKYIIKLDAENIINDFKPKTRIQKSDIIEAFKKSRNHPLTVNDLTDKFGRQNKLVIHSYLGQLLASRAIKKLGISDQTKEKYNPVYEYVLSDVDVEIRNEPKVKDLSTNTISSEDIENFLAQQGIITNFDYIFDGASNLVNLKLQDKIKKLNENPKPSVEDFKKLFVGEKDIFSKKKLLELQQEVPGSVNLIITDLFPHNKTMQTVSLRWILRGLKLEYAIKKAATDMNRYSLYHGPESRGNNEHSLEEALLMEFNGILEKYPNDEDALSIKAMVLYDLDRKNEALQICKQLIDINPENEEALFLKGTIFHEFNRNEEALKICERLIEIDSGNQNVFELKAKVLYELSHNKNSSLIENVAIEQKSVAKTQLQQLINNLKSDDENLRLMISSDLVKIGDSAVESLIEALECDDQHFQLRVVSILGRIGNPAAIIPLIKLSKSTYDPLRESIVVALGRIGDPSSVDCLIFLLEDSNRHVRSKASDSLVKIGKPAVKVLQERKNERNDHFRLTINTILKKIQ